MIQLFLYEHSNGVVVGFAAKQTESPIQTFHREKLRYSPAIEIIFFFL